MFLERIMTKSKLTKQQEREFIQKKKEALERLNKTLDEKKRTETEQNRIVGSNFPDHYPLVFDGKGFIDTARCEEYGQTLDLGEQIKYYHSLKKQIIAWSEDQKQLSKLIWGTETIDSYMKWCDFLISRCEAIAPFSERAVSDSTSVKKPVYYSFVKSGEVWEIEYKEDKKVFTDKKGMHYIQHLLKKPNEETHVTELHSLVHLASLDSHEKAYSLMTVRELEQENLTKNNPVGVEIFDDYV